MAQDQLSGVPGDGRGGESGEVGVGKDGRVLDGGGQLTQPRAEDDPDPGPAAVPPADGGDGRGAPSGGSGGVGAPRRPGGG